MKNQFFGKLPKVCRNLKNKGYDLILIPFSQNNVERLRVFSQKENIFFFEDWFNVESTLNLIANCKLLIGQKMHSLGLSAVAGTPFIGLEYQPKCRELADSVGFNDYIIRTDEISQEKIMRLIDSLIQNYDSLQYTLENKVELYRKRQKIFAAKIMEDIEKLPDYFWESTFQKKIVNEAYWAVDSLVSKKGLIWYCWNKLIFDYTWSVFT